MGHRTCAALHCLSSSYNNKDLKFHQFPHDAERRKIWITACKISDVIDKDWDFFKHKYVCSLHFQKYMYGKKDRLKKSAIPSLHLSEKPLQHYSTQAVKSVQYVNQRSENVSKSYVMPNVENNSTTTYTQAEDSLQYDINQVNMKEVIITPTQMEESESVELDVEIKTENDDENSDSASLVPILSEKDVEIKTEKVDKIDSGSRVPILFEEDVQMKTEIVENEILPLVQSTQSLQYYDLEIIKYGGTLSSDGSVKAGVAECVEGTAAECGGVVAPDVVVARTLSEKPLQHDSSTQTVESIQYVNQQSENDVSVMYVVPNLEKSSTTTYTQTEESLPYDINHVNIKEEIITHDNFEESESVEQYVEIKTENDDDENSDSGAFEDVKMDVEIVENEILPLLQSTQSLQSDDLEIIKDGGTLSTQARNPVREIDQGLTATIVNRTITNPINTTMMPILKRKMDGSIQTDRVIVLSLNADGSERSTNPEECKCNRNNYIDMTRLQYYRACSNFLSANFAATVRRQMHLGDVTIQGGNKLCEAGSSGSVKAGTTDCVELNAAGCGGVVLPDVIIAATETADSAEADLYAVDRVEASAAASAADSARSYTDCPFEEQPAPSPSPSSSRPPPRYFRRNLRPQDIAEVLNYGSDQSSDNDDDEEEGLLFPRPSRTLQSVMETPLDEDFGVGGDGDVYAPAAESEASDSVPLTATDQPRRWYDFEWKEFPNSLIQPESRRETFSQINVGPTTPRDDPYAIFVDIWDRPIMEHIVSETNKYAQMLAGQMMADNIRPNSRICRWRETTVDELYVYFGIILAMGVVVKSRIEEYWSATCNIFCTPGFGAHMSIDRFLILNKCLHFNDNDGMRGLDLDVSEARLYKVKPILSHLNNKFQELYNPAQNIALDESILMWKGWLDIGQLIPNKTAQKGIKTYEVCESRTGYLWRFEVHAHKENQSPPQQFEDPLEASTPSIVLRLTQGLEHKGYTLWMDNFYNSPCLARRLKSLGFDCVGTLRTDRKFVPQALHRLTKRGMCQGQVAGLTSGDVDIMVWKDCNRVATISTYHGNAVRTIRGSTKPILILDYNIMMGGVDKKDQLLAMYPVERKRTMVWYKKLFRRLLNISVLNSFIIHRHSSSHLTHRNFRMQLILALFSYHRPMPIPISISPATTQNPRFDVSTLRRGEPPEPFYAFIHRIEEYGMGPCSNERRRARRRCKVCKKKITTFCVGCNIALCWQECFAKLHPHPRPIPL